MTQRIRDPVHGLIVFGGSGDPHRDETDRIAWRLLNAREFQRLRRIRQLGFSDLVFKPGGNLHLRLRRALNDGALPWRDDLLFDEPEVTSYRWYDFDDDSALNKVLVKPRQDVGEPVDIADISAVVEMLRGTERLRRVYAPEVTQAKELRSMLKEART